MPVILCLDPGMAHTGLAISYEGELANPLATIFEKDLDQLVGRLIPFLVQYGPEMVVIGVPEHGPLVAFANGLAEKLKKVYLGEVVFFSEALSSADARKVMKETHKTLFERKKEEHQTAAALILQAFLDENT